MPTEMDMLPDYTVLPQNTNTSKQARIERACLLSATICAEIILTTWPRRDEDCTLSSPGAQLGKFIVCQSSMPINAKYVNGQKTRKTNRSLSKFTYHRSVRIVGNNFMVEIFQYRRFRLYMSQLGQSRVSWATRLVDPLPRITTHGILRKFQHHLVVNCDITYMATLSAQIILQVGSFVVQKGIFRYSQ